MTMNVTLTVTTEELHALLAAAGANREVLTKAGLTTDECALLHKWRTRAFFVLHGFRDHNNAVEAEVLKTDKPKGTP